jgi:NitT/TauT family transport system substrate-binding protein
MRRIGSRRLNFAIYGAMAALIACAGAAFAEAIIVSNYGTAASAMPYAIALKKGYFQEFGADVDAILDMDGVAAVQRLLKDGLAYAEVAPAAVAEAAQTGNDISIISGNVYTVEGYAWVVLPSSPIHSVADLKGKGLGYSSDGSTTDALNRLLLAKASLSPSDVRLNRVGGLLPAFTYIEIKGIDTAPIPEPLRSIAGSKYKTIATADVLPPIADAVGITTASAKLEKANFIRGVLKARRKAVAYLHENPADATGIVAVVYKADPAVIERVIRSIIEKEKAKGEKYWETDAPIKVGPIKSAIPPSRTAQMASGASASDANLSRLIDNSLLADIMKPSSGRQ